MTGDALVHQVLRSISVRAYQHLRKQEMSVVAKEILDKLMALIPEATQPLLEGWFIMMPPSYFKSEPQTCHKCKELLGQEVAVPK
jgi:hypothetical protein